MSERDPEMSADWKKQTPFPQCLMRIKRDIKTIFSDPPPGVFIVPDESDMTLIHALIIGCRATPYEGGFFYMLVRIPPDYPIQPPRVKLMTTGEGKVGFNPNLYPTGRVCLSILGTFSGPSWSPAQSLQTVLISIQSLLNENPFFNEPMYGRAPSEHRAESDRYNSIIRHETLRVAVCDMLEETTADSRNLPKPLRTVMEKSFLRFYDRYESTAKAVLGLNKRFINDPHSARAVYIDYTSILGRLQKIKEKLEKKRS